MLYAGWFFSTKFQCQGIVPFLIYFGFMGLVSLGFSMMGGCIGVVSALWFNKKLYALVNLSETAEENEGVPPEAI